MKITICTLLLIAMLGCNKGRTRVISGLEGKPLPLFDMLLTDSSTHIRSENIPIGHPFVLFYFNPSCPYCRAQTESLKKNISSLKEIQFYFIAPYPIYQLKKFDNRYGISKYQNITLAQVRDTSFEKYYMINAVPYFAIYNREKQLKEILLGRVNVDIIKEIALGK